MKGKKELGCPMPGIGSALMGCRRDCNRIAAKLLQGWKRPGSLIVQSVARLLLVGSVQQALASVAHFAGLGCKAHDGSGGLH